MKGGETGEKHTVSVCESKRHVFVEEAGLGNSRALQPEEVEVTHVHTEQQKANENEHSQAQSQKTKGSYSTST
eukprot:m.355864 g.355864  ORF g.355864 m.355864 type:complete len:73 (+) comp17361_c0_seq1:785-1003(+)